jgi:hypothetical protein
VGCGARGERETKRNALRRGALSFFSLPRGEERARLGHAPHQAEAIGVLCLVLHAHAPQAWRTPSLLSSFSNASLIRASSKKKKKTRAALSHAPLSHRPTPATVRALREELQLLQEPGSYVGEVVKV